MQVARISIAARERGEAQEDRSHQITSSAVLLTGYILQRAYVEENHWAVFEGWTLAGSYVLGPGRLVARGNADSRFRRPHNA